jgi:hypothetical protein
MLSTIVQFLSYGTRVCAGWSIDEISNEEGITKIDPTVYLIKRSYFFQFVGFIGFNALIAFLYFEIRKKSRGPNQTFN